ncbi:MAG: S-methyl-5-thioribose-1-phosphate isomerase, partial [Candidatus Omnitrophica bacterium]|nr:S-methyl-5-thioribose-1-phosphate isomerase [Candidatus Omnitrophota bacterium]
MLLEPIKWKANKIIFIDQTELPSRLKYVRCGDITTLCEAIRKLRLRGAPLIGVSVALGYALAAIKSRTRAGLREDLRKASGRLKATRPTAVNLFWAMKRMEDAFSRLPADMGLRKVKRSLLKEALSILIEDQDMCRAIGRNGALLIKNRDIILTHCNAGMLATAGQGTALSIFY